MANWKFELTEETAASITSMDTISRTISEINSDFSVVIEVSMKQLVSSLPTEFRERVLDCYGYFESELKRRMTDYVESSKQIDNIINLAPCRKDILDEKSGLTKNHGRD